MSKKQIGSGDDQLTEISEDEDITTLKKGDLYIIGQLWITALKTGLLGTKWSLIPTVHAAAPPPPPQKPPPMAYKDLPIYQSPHYEYKDYVQDKYKETCPKYKTKLMHETFYPCVSSWRKYYSNLFYEVKRDCHELASDLSKAVGARKDAFVSYMRSPDNYEIRTATVVAGGLTGFCIGYPGGMPRKIFCTGLGLLATGALTFPKATDDAFREFSYHTCKLIISVYNFYTKNNFNLRERIPCRDEMPPPPTPKRPANVCPAPKK